MWPFTPRYIKHAKLLHKGVTRFINYKRDILPPKALDQINGLRDQLKAAIKARDSKLIDKLHDQINDACNKALPDAKSGEFADNIEVFFVAIVVALGIRAYIAQPFQIPTGSMQPTLNGYIAQGTKEDPTPNIFKRLIDKAAGKTYINVVSDHDGYIKNSVDYVTEHRWLVLFTYSKINFEDGHSISVSAPKSRLVDELGLNDHLRIPTQVATGPDGKELLTPDARSIRERAAGRVFVSKGQLLARGVLNAGDHIIVNKFAYHFRTPKRGEVFVFTTHDIQGIEGRPDFDKAQGSQHYIKRLVGVPGDTLEVKSPELWINGKPADEFGIKRVGSMKPPYAGYGSYGYLQQGEQKKLGEDEYWAMGDNSYNSSDSRYWGVVPERNIVGPALFCYLPFTSHWGPIW
jgi:signal peptidase I